ncbi:MAG: hypothetical protein K9N49_10915 [Candidatus Marinimicrobia bacterium]|nr:hypothetical protein [Candidatus Neomarinimicrobiota bacterium]
MRFHREQYLDHLLSRGSSREIFVELFGPLQGLEAEWRAQGASAAELSLDAFDFDSVERVGLGRTGPRGDRPERLEVETEEYTIRVDNLGRRMKLIKSSASIPLPLDFPVRDMDDWRAVRHWLTDAPERTDETELEMARIRRAQGALSIVNMPGGFDLPRQLMGDEEACLAFYDAPELIHDILNTAADTVCAVIHRAVKVCPVDYLAVHEDFAGKSGPLVGPDLIAAFIRPYYLRIWNAAREAGAQVFSLDSDGNVNPVIDALMAAGVNQIYPMEPAAGMDIVALRRKYGRSLILKGGLDKHVLRQSQAAIRAELEYKLQPALRGGGVVFGLDHRIPNGTPLEQYRFYVRTARELLGLPPAEPRHGAWARMAF